MGAGGQNKGAGGTPMPGQGKGAGGTPQFQNGANGGIGQPPVDDMRLRQQEMNQQHQAYLAAQGGNQRAQQWMAKQAGIAGLGNRQAMQQRYQQMADRGGFNGPNTTDFMPGGRLAASNELAASDPYAVAAQQAMLDADPAAAAKAAGTQPAIGTDAAARMQSAMTAQQQRSPGSGFMPNGMPDLSNTNQMAGPAPVAPTPIGPASQFGPIGSLLKNQTSYGSKGGGGGSPKGGGGNVVPQKKQNGMDARGFANGGIVGLADGGRLGAVSGGGVTYGPASAAPPPMAAPFAAPVAAAPVAVAPAAAPAWTPQAVTAGNGGMFSGIASVPIAQPAKWSGPTTPQKLWQAPAKPVAAAGPAGLSQIDMNRAILFGVGDTSKMTDRQYATYLNMRSMTRGNLSGGGGGSSHGDRGGYSR